MSLSYPRTKPGHGHPAGNDAKKNRPVRIIFSPTSDQGWGEKGWGFSEGAEVKGP